MTANLEESVVIAAVALVNRWRQMRALTDCEWWDVTTPYEKALWQAVDAMRDKETYKEQTMATSTIPPGVCDNIGQMTENDETGLIAEWMEAAPAGNREAPGCVQWAIDQILDLREEVVRLRASLLVDRHHIADWKYATCAQTPEDAKAEIKRLTRERDEARGVDDRSED